MPGMLSLEHQRKGSGFIFNPAAVDNAVQLGPVIGPLGVAPPKDGDPPARGGARVLAAVGALHATSPPRRDSAFAAAEKLPIGPDGTLYISHWIANPGGSDLCIRDLQVIPCDTSRGNKVTT
jgi:hypothetical protein